MKIILTDAALSAIEDFKQTAENAEEYPQNKVDVMLADCERVVFTEVTAELEKLQNAKFAESFGDASGYVMEGDSVSIEINGCEYTARIIKDNDYSIDDDEVHNVDQSLTDCDDEQ